ncbi:hypothetical protein MA16_Dca026396 [Dendrobium catenatum]|uniref:Uncharacterized protein n=1 Tax=Dendrobium catenatum TaxID=906689 RepID=A0A2I0WS82_9ASPA|nr:hypothetical protein MA16_Dca026396 [Dendrobium catenatum]
MVTAPVDHQHLQPVSMIVPRSSGSLRSSDRKSNGIVIREGAKPVNRQEPVEGKGKNVMMDELDARVDTIVEDLPSLMNVESSASQNLVLRDFQKHVEIGEKTVKPVESSQPDLLQIAETGLESAGKSLAKKKKSKHLKDLRPITENSVKTNGPWLLANYGKKRNKNFGFKKFNSGSKEEQGFKNAVVIPENQKHSMVNTGKKTWKEVGLGHLGRSMEPKNVEIETVQELEDMNTSDVSKKDVMSFNLPNIDVNKKFNILNNLVEEGEIVSNEKNLEIARMEDMKEVNTVTIGCLEDNKEDEMKDGNSSILKRIQNSLMV